jgi:hypothetical protein
MSDIILLFGNKKHGQRNMGSMAWSKCSHDMSDIILFGKKKGQHDVCSMARK